MVEYEPVIGLEVHAELKTASKMYCSCENRFGAEPNTLVCPVCMGLPGTLPRLNKKAVELAVKAGIAMNCTIQQGSYQDRKNYFYPDLPKSYQISQSERPLCKNGYLDVLVEGQRKRVRIERIHIEEDAGKLIHDPQSGTTLADYVRCGVPLIEIVTEPDIGSSQEAHAFLETVRSTLKALDISDCKMQEGSVRCDVNVSLREKGSPSLGTRCEMKNVNSFSGAVRGIEYEISRQLRLLTARETIRQETRRWDDAKGLSTVMRTKENAMDYRFFPEPDLGLITVPEELISRIRSSMPELPGEKLFRYTEELGLKEQEAKIIAFDTEKARLFEASLSSKKASARTLCSLIVGEITKFLKDNSCEIRDMRLTPEELAELAGDTEQGRISSSSAKKVLKELLTVGGNVKEITKRLGLEQDSDPESIKKLVTQVIAQQPEAVREFRNGKTSALNHIIGLCMKASKGRADPAMVRKFAEKLINDKEV
ncbi:MAG: Asp-tRNA(Asn)/Glu-tRNA(Gln) amidotransferase subunit GatB [Ruminococcus sp.]|nr:Asp-tRNA(Asn)/Glu-tRNA(Gln) amidotransferase subunit GatB [Ruminococcus sp.]